jgi:hypothetical protein
MLDPGFEMVYTMTDVHDGPRRGMADFKGTPHLYVSEWDSNLERFLLEYKLSPVPEAVFLLAMEDWSIWQRWQSAFDQGKTTVKTHPALPEDQARNQELERILEERLILDRDNITTAFGRFEERNDSSWPGFGPIPLQVCWTVLEPASA